MPWPGCPRAHHCANRRNSSLPRPAPTSREKTPRRCFPTSSHAALAIYETVDDESLNPSEAEEKQLRQAYCLLKFARYDEATPIYNALLATPLANAARFYLAYTDYVNDRWSAAMNGFSKVVVDNSDPARMTPYYLAQLYYRDGDWKKAYAEASKLIKGNCPAEYLPEMLRVAGESLYGMGETDKAVAALKQYLQLTDRPLPSALYIVGVDDYNRGDYKNAIRLLTDVVTQDNARKLRRRPDGPRPGREKRLRQRHHRTGLL